MRIVYIGCVRFSHTMLHALRNHPEAEIVGVVTRREAPFNADFMSLEPLAGELGAPVFLADEEPDDRMAAWIGAQSPDVIFCFGWSTLLKRPVLEAAPKGVIGYHPAMLPANRGRHPIIWSLALGLEETGSTFFFMDEGADSGDIASQARIAIRATDTAETLYRQIEETALQQLAPLLANLNTDAPIRTAQDPAAATSWRKRSATDGQIDWRMSARSICNLVRALAHPYPGAHCLHGGREIKIWDTRVETDAPINAEPGKILRVSAGEIVIKCGENALAVLEHEFETLPHSGEYL